MKHKMSKEKKQTRRKQSKTGPACPIAFALESIGDRWSLLIVRDLLFKEKRFYGDFLSSPENISTNVLADRLSKLEKSGMISKTRDDEHLSRFIYRLTEKGKDLLPTVLEMIAWSAKYDPAQANAPSCIVNGAPNRLLKRLKDDRQALIDEILSELDQ